ncbi:MAG: alpha/beta hydrolase [bacterium]
MLEQKIKIKNLEINYKYYGERLRTPNPSQEGKNIFLILHGWGGSSDSWEKVCEFLKNDYEIYALDFPFFGKSDNLDEVWKVDNYVELVEEFARDVIGNSATIKSLTPTSPPQVRNILLIAHSFGGRVAIKIATKNPKWLKKLYLCDAAGIKHSQTIKQKIAGIIAKIGKKNKELKRDDNSHGKIPPIRLSLRAGSNPPLEKGGIIRKGFYKIFSASDYYNCKNEIMRETFKNIIAEDLTPYLSEIKIPTVIIWGDKDKYTPLADGILMNKKIKNSERHIIKGIGHGIHIFAPDKVYEIIKKTLPR